MNGKKGTGSENPWIKPQPDDEPNEPGSENQLPPSPWSQEVPQPPSPWTTPGVPSGPGASFGAGPASDTSAAWGDHVSAPSLRRPAPEPKRWKLPPLLVPIAAGVAVVALLAVALVLLTGGDNTADPPQTTPTVPVTTPTPSTYSPPPNAIAVGFGVSLVPLDGWSVLAKETQGKQLISYAPNRDPRAFFWVRQKENLTANTYLLRIVEGETAGEVTQLGNVRKLACPRDVLVECVAISYTSTAKAGTVKGFVEAYRRKDGVVTAIDFRSRTDFSQKAEPDAETMKKSVIDSL
ncbi:MAG TPA: hypothetical protein VGD71_09205 [Kribbella sp.]